MMSGPSSASADPPPWLPTRWRPYRRSTFTLGVDLGQSADPTALCLVEREVEWRVDMHRCDEHRPGPPRYLVRHLERLPLGLSYVAQAEHVRRLMAAEPLGGRVELVADKTGVGAPVVDLLREAGLRPIAVQITAGSDEAGRGDDWRVSKLLLVSKLQALLHGGALKVARSLPLAAELAQELGHFRVSYHATGYMGFGARAGAHDDLVLGLALAVWWAARPRAERQMVPLRGL
jgi:hypothetical protein